jgi:hypothetical protein
MAEGARGEKWNDSSPRFVSKALILMGDWCGGESADSKK